MQEGDAIARQELGRGIVWRAGVKRAQAVRSYGVYEEDEDQGMGAESRGYHNGRGEELVDGRLAEISYREARARRVMIDLQPAACPRACQRLYAAGGLFASARNRELNLTRRHSISYRNECLQRPGP